MNNGKFSKITNKTTATWLALTLGSLGMHRFYVYGWRDIWAWLSWLLTALGGFGLWRLQTLGVNDELALNLLPILAFNVALPCFFAIRWGLMTPEAWQKVHMSDTFHSRQDAEGKAETTVTTVVGVIFALMLGTTALLIALVLVFQRYFELQF